jgi:hypothetical protein
MAAGVDNGAFTVTFSPKFFLERKSLSGLSLRACSSVEKIEGPFIHA